MLQTSISFVLKLVFLNFKAILFCFFKAEFKAIYQFQVPSFSTFVLIRLLFFFIEFEQLLTIRFFFLTFTFIIFWLSFCVLLILTYFAFLTMLLFSFIIHTFLVTYQFIKFIVLPFQKLFLMHCMFHVNFNLPVLILLNVPFCFLLF